MFLLIRMTLLFPNLFDYDLRILFLLRCFDVLCPPAIVVIIANQFPPAIVVIIANHFWDSICPVLRHRFEHQSSDFCDDILSHWGGSLLFVLIDWYN